MTVWSKLLSALRGGANEVGEAIVDSQALRILDQEIRDADVELRKSREALASIMARHRLAQERVEKGAAQVAEYEQYAIKALEAGNEELAREVAEKIATLENQLEGERAQVAEFAASVAQLRKSVSQAEGNIRQLKQQVDTVKATESVQKAQMAVAQRYGNSKSKLQTAVDSLERIKQRQAERAATMDAAAELASAAAPDDALDAKLREEMQIELINLQKDVGITFVYVTHDQGEALALSHRIAVMNQGRVEQLDAPETIYSFPRSRFVADFIGQCNLLDATVEAVDGERVRIDLRGLGEVQALKSFDAQPGEACVLTLRPEKIRLAQSVTADSDEVHFRGRVAELLYLGDVTLYIVELENGERLETLLPNATPGRAKFFEVGDAVEAAWRFDAGHLVRA